MDFKRRVLTVVRAIPHGKVATYGEVAALAGRPRAHRAVGTIMRNCREPGVPCHRVIAAGGMLGGFGGSPALKRQLLLAEGVTVVGVRIRSLADVQWRPPRRWAASTPRVTSPSGRTARGGGAGRT